MAVTSFETPLLKKEKNSSDAWNFYFKKPKSFEYSAGQYIKMKLDISEPDNRGVTRYFTLSSSPTDDYMMVTTRILKSTFKMRLNDVKIGEKVHMRGPWGDFFLTEKDIKPRVMIAGGIGMTPYHSMLRFAAAKGLTLPLKLFVSYKTPDQILYKEELEELQKNNKNLKIITTVTEPEGTGWKGQTGRINTKLLQKNLDSFGGNLYYVSGPDPMVSVMEKALKDVGISGTDILTDGFPGY